MFRVMSVSFCLLCLFALSAYASEQADEWKQIQISSPHPYTNLFDKKYRIVHAGAAKIAIHFSRLEIAKSDVLTIEDATGNIIASYTATGDLRDFYSDEIPGDTAIIRLITNESITRWGFEIDKYRYKTRNLSEPSVIKEIRTNEWITNVIGSRNNTFYVWHEIENGFRGYQIDETGLKSLRTKCDIDPTNVAACRVIGWLGEFPIVGGIRSSLLNLATGQKYSLHPNGVAAIETDDRGFIYVKIYEEGIQVIDTKTSSGWMQILADRNLIAAASRFTVNDKWLVSSGSISCSSRNLTVYDVSDPYAPKKTHNFELNGNTIDKPVLNEDHAFIAVQDKQSLSSYQLSTGYEVGQISLPQPARLAKLPIGDDSCLHLFGHDTIYGVDVSDPENMKLVRSLRITRLPIFSIDYLLKSDNRLYVLWRLGNGTDQAISMIDLPNGSFCK